MNRFIRNGLSGLSTIPVDNTVEKPMFIRKKSLRNEGLSCWSKFYANDFNREIMDLIIARAVGEPFGEMAFVKPSHVHKLEINAALRQGKSDR